jgi:Phosphatidylinositol-4-phosphate 5-Kinase
MSFQLENRERCIYELSKNDQSKITITEHSSTIFAELRDKFGVSLDELFDSFSPIYNVQAIHNFFTGSGKSPSFFFFSDNKKFVLKTMKPSEKRLLFENGVLDSYHKYMVGNNGSTLLSKFYGVFTFSTSNMQDITCVIMDNLIGADFMNIKRIYDLKGSTVGRSVKLTQEQIDSGNSGMKVLKDLNFLDLNEKLELEQNFGNKKEKLFKILERDSNFLSSNGLMDYSLLFIKVK